jgi:iron(III) transport system permease protein
VRSRHPGRHIVELLAWLPWSIPGILLGVSMPWLILSTPFVSALYGSLTSLVIILIISQMPIGVHMMKTSILQIAPELEQSSRVCGAGVFYTFFTVVLPLIRPMLVSIFIIVFIAAIRDISTVIFISNASTQTLSLLMIQFAASSNLEASAVIGIITTVIAITAALAARALGLDLSTQR